MKFLIIEDDPGVVETVSIALQMRWHGARIVSTHLGERGIELVKDEAPDVVILDLGLPDINGFEVLKRIRLFSNVPIIILTVRGDEADVVKGLEWGADDYIVKPFRQMELIARIGVHLRGRAVSDELPLTCGPLRFEPSTRQLFRGDKEIYLTATESIIMRHLMENAGRVVTHSSLAEEIWGRDYPGAADSIKVYIRRLREKIEEDPSSPKLILTKPGVGYRLVKPG